MLLTYFHAQAATYIYWYIYKDRYTNIDALTYIGTFTKIGTLQRYVHLHGKLIHLHIKTNFSTKAYFETHASKDSGRKKGLIYLSSAMTRKKIHSEYNNYCKTHVPGTVRLFETYGMITTDANKAM